MMLGDGGEQDGLEMVGYMTSLTRILAIHVKIHIQTIHYIHIKHVISIHMLSIYGADMVDI